MSPRKYVKLEETIDILLGDDYVCCEKAIVILPPEQGYGHATDLEQVRMMLVVARRHC